MDEIEIIRAGESDLDTILQLQYAAFHDEAEAFNDYSIEPLSQTTDDLMHEYSYRIFLKAVYYGQIIGSVRVHTVGDTVHIGKLIVHPGYQNKGLGKRLLNAAECMFPHTRCELNAAKRMNKNIMLYTHCGYVAFKEIEDEFGRIFVYMENGRKGNNIGDSVDTQ